MGITSQDFAILQKAMEASGAAIDGLKMCELGAQYLQVEGVFRGVAKKYFASLGVKHVSFDLNGLHGSLAVDLRLPVDPKYRGAFDLVTNFGTTEHVTRQHACFENIHDLCRPGGVMMHSVPPPGHWQGHGRFYYPLEFFDGLAEANGYELLHREITPGLSQEIEPLAAVVLRRTSDAAFMGAAAFAALPVEEDEQNVRVNDYLGRPPPLRRLWRSVKRILRGRSS